MEAFVHYSGLMHPSCPQEGWGTPSEQALICPPLLSILLLLISVQTCLFLACFLSLYFFKAPAPSPNSLPWGSKLFEDRNHLWLCLFPIIETESKTMTHNSCIVKNVKSNTKALWMHDLLLARYYNLPFTLLNSWTICKMPWYKSYYFPLFYRWKN